ncbi:formate C-acetyltransferase [Flavobacterium sp. KACC 22763]|uniref:formate C-acetyltransferase n=1 Tax=Flavobacterium sp. KACC 22763 TaxID=3025668 RepID=UPI002366427D|nr:formate C-acetyltransferase [Flavobacterium sp. KACC 22763]WDF64000.1 formate C-acetyltransferase [Flavobacterium sp. KACC 22763]
MKASVEKIEFVPGKWETSVNVQDFVVRNITPYNGDSSFLCGPSSKTSNLWNICKKALLQERANSGCLAIDVETISSINAFKPGYINEEDEVIVGLQTDQLLKRAMKPFGGIKLVESAVKERGLKVSDRVLDIFNYAKNHNEKVFDAYDKEIRDYRSKHILTGLPDNYARGRIIGDFRRMALYGVNQLIAFKKEDYAKADGEMREHKVRLREEISAQISALKDMLIMAEDYGFDISQPAQNAKEAVQWVYFAYLAAVKEQDGAAMSLGNVSSFLDIYIQRDLELELITEDEAQELVDQFVMKLRMVRHLRPGAYDEIFGGDPTWVTECIGGMFNDGRTKVTKTSFRFLQTLYNLGASPEPNLTVLWSEDLPEGFKNFCAEVSIDTSSIQYENDDLMRTNRGSDDYGIACCVSHQEIGKSIQHFGARANLPKALLIALNGGREEKGGALIMKDIPFINDEILDYDVVYNAFKNAMKELARVYAKSMYIIHYMHDKYYYERAQMALIDSDPHVDIAYGAAGISIIADSLSAIKYAKVKPVRDENGLTVDFIIEGDYPKFGNDDDRVDTIAKEVTSFFVTELRKHTAYKNATPTLSLLTITSNVMYGTNTGATPDGRKDGESFAPGANPMHGRDNSGAIASLNSVAKLEYKDAQDGISNTFSMIPKSLGDNREEQVTNLVNVLDGYFAQMAYHLNVNVLNREMLQDAYDHPENHPQLTIRVSGYAVNFVRLSRAHQLEVIARTFHEAM